MNNKKSSFTLIEMLVVISIIAILASMLLSALGESKTSVKKKVAESQMQAIKMALKAYKNDFRIYPNANDDSTYDDVSDTDLAKLWTGNVKYWDGSKTADSAEADKVIPDAWGDPHKKKADTTYYHLSGSGSTVTITCYGPDNKENGDDDITLELK